MKRPCVAIIGYGDFAKLMIKHLSPFADIVVSSRQPRLHKQGLNFKSVSQAEALAQPVIIPSMPAQYLEDFFTANKQLINPQALVVDVCSVKVKPVEVLQRVLPATTQILATHPLFGPASAASGLKDLKIMLYPVRLPAARYQRVKAFCRHQLQLKVIECTPEAHDQMMAYAQGLSHYIGRLMQVMEIPTNRLSTSAYDDLLDMKQIQGGDSWELFESIMFENPYALSVNADFKAAIKDLDAKLGIK